MDSIKNQGFPYQNTWFLYVKNHGFLHGLLRAPG